MTEGSGGGSVGRPVASDTKNLRFESRHRQNLIYQLYNQNTEKTKIEEKEAGNCPSLKKISMTDAFFTAKRTLMSTYRPKYVLVVKFARNKFSSIIDFATCE